MARTGGSSPPPGACWFCERGAGGGNSLALPFWSQTSDDVRVLVLPRCDRCFEFHHRQQYPSGLIVVAGAAVPLVVVSQLPLPEQWRTLISVSTLLAGFAAGLVVAANRDDWQARAQGTRPLFAYVQHPPYHALAADQANWRQYLRPGVGSGIGRGTVADFERYFTGISDDPAAVAALRRGCAEAGVPWGER
jgi:hypothetical protein